MQHDHEPDLATIILDAEGRRGDGWRASLRGRIGALRAPRIREYDTSSIAVLALAALVAVVVLGFVVAGMRTEETPPAADPAPTVTGPLQAPGAELVPGAASGVGSDAPSAPATTLPPRGVDVVASRISAVKTPGRFGVTVRARVANTRSSALGADRGALVTLLVDGGVAAARPLALPAATTGGPAARVETFQLQSCTAGMHSVTLVVDSTARVVEANEADNARSGQFEWSC